MGLKKTENQVQVLLKDTILALCRNTLNYHAEICIEGLLCITLDCEEVLLVNINQIIKNREVPRKIKKKRKRAAETTSDEDELFTAVSPKAKCERKSANKESAAVVTLLNEHCDRSSDTDRRSSVDLLCTAPEETKKPYNLKKDTDSPLCENKCIVKEEPPDVIVVKEEIENDLLPSGDIMNNYVTSESFSANLGHSPNTLHASEYQDLQCQDDMLPNLNHAVGSPELMASFAGSASNLPSGGAAGTLHVCLLCGKSFAWQWLLKRHQVVHSGDKDYSCEHCQRTFSYQSSVKRHQEKCPARLEARLDSFQHNPPGVSPDFASTPDDASTPGHLNYPPTKLKQHARFNFRMNCASPNDGMSD